MASNSHTVVLSPAIEAAEVELDISPEDEATIPFVTPVPSNQHVASPKPKPLVKIPSSPGARSTHLKTPLDTRKSAPVTIRIGNGASPALSSSRHSRPSSRRFSGDIELEKMSVNVLEVFDTGSRRPSALDILSHTGSEGAAAAVERAKERRNIVIWMHRITQILLYILPTLIVLCLILYWTIEDGKLKWLTMMAAVLGIACVVDFILFQYFTNRAEGTDLLNTVAIFRARLQKSGRRF
ncbi:uncharacterized protein LOC134819328 isoform X1 [Bolinopsis microptera]|uniref:uncharacterized protein LOC134819328 isoform X1 n=1 Tax=Bolinopsis microptera TaxID=2820187 RepID=UPI003079EE87